MTSSKGGGMAYLGTCLIFSILVAPVRGQLTWDQTAVTLKPSLTDVKGTAVYGFKNKGTSLIRIVEIKFSCACTTAELEKQEFQPGEGGRITATINYEHRLGMQRATVLVKTDEKSENIQRLDLNADIPSLLTMEPAYLCWEARESSSAKTIMIHVNPQGGDVKVKAPPENLYYTSQLTKTAANTYRLEIVPKEPRKNVSLRVSIETDHPNPKHRLYSAQLDIR